jgi:hypothetical protein
MKMNSASRVERQNLTRPKCPPRARPSRSFVASGRCASASRSIASRKSKIENSFAWSDILKSLTRFAQAQIDRRRWRYQYGGVLPEGFDAESIAAEAISQFLTRNSDHAGAQRGLAIQSRKSEIEDDTASELRRLVVRQVDRLHHLKENWLLSNEPDLATVYDDGQFVSPAHLVPDTSPRPDRALLEVESDREFAKLAESIDNHLAADTELQSLFRAMLDGKTHPRILSSALNLTVPCVKNLKKKLRRHVRPLFFRVSSLPPSELDL